MAGSVVVFSPHPLWARVRLEAPCRALSVGAGFLLVGSLLAAKHLGLPDFASETLAGLAVMIVIVKVALGEIAGTPRRGLRALLNHRRVLLLGVFSYSIYLIHSPLLGLINLLTLNLPLSDDLRFLLMLTVAVPLSLLCSYGFYLLVERRFLSGHQRDVQPAAAHAWQPVP